MSQSEGRNKPCLLFIDRLLVPSLERCPDSEPVGRPAGRPVGWSDVRTELYARRSAIGRLWEPFLWATGRWRSVFGCQKVFLPLAKSITTTRPCLTQAGAGCWEYFFNVKNIQKSFPKAWGSMGEARGKRGGSVGEAGGSRGIFRGSAFFDPRKRSVLGGSNRPQYPF